MALPSELEIASMTPMMAQFFQIKKQAEDAIVFFRMGDFYEIFGDDAEDVAPKLDLVLTSREKGNQTRIPFCGVPHHSARSYWLKLLTLGYKVAIADQVEEASVAKGLVRREITRIYTPGCLDELEALAQDRPNYVMVVYEEPGTSQFALAVGDLTTGELRAGRVDGPAQLEKMVYKFRPKEIVTRRFFKVELEILLSAYLKEDRLVFGSLSEGLIRDQREQQLLIQDRLGQCQDLSGLDIVVVSGLFHYLDSLRASTLVFNNVRPLQDPATMALDEVAIRDLEIFETVRRRSREGSLFGEINRCQTAMGARRLHQSLLNPLLKPEQILHRQNGVKWLLNHPEALKELELELKGLPDLERILARVLSGRCSPTELHRMRSGLQKVQGLVNSLEKAGLSDGILAKQVLGKLKTDRSALALLERSLADDLAALGADLACIREGFDGDFDRLRDSALHGEAKIKSYEELLRQQTGINSLKIKGHKTYGLLIEVTKTNLSRIPETFIRRQTMVNNERFVTSELQELDEDLSQAREQAVAVEGQLYQRILSELSYFQDGIRELAQGVAGLDLLVGFALKAQESEYVCPTLSTTGLIALKGSRHPVIEQHVGRHDFTPNDIELSQDQKTVIITGPNMAGKSTVMRQLAVTALMHQIGSFIPARQGELPIFDQIFTRIGASDDIAQGKSTFMVEMSEASTILRQSTNHSLVILDEVGRGTSTEDGVAIALAILEDLSHRVRCYCLFATHFHDLIPLIAGNKSVQLLQTEVAQSGPDQALRFTHRIIPGAASHSFGIEVAKLAGIPKAVISRARDYLRTPDKSLRILPQQEIVEVSVPTKSNPRIGAVIAKLESISVDRTTPMQALNQLAHLQSLLNSPLQEQLFPVLKGD